MNIYDIKNKKGPRIELCEVPVIPDNCTTYPDDMYFVYFNPLISMTNIRSQMF